MLDSNGKPWVLECNNNPSFNIDHDIFENNKEVTEISYIDKIIKEKVISDTLYVINKKISK